MTESFKTLPIPIFLFIITLNFTNCVITNVTEDIYNETIREIIDQLECELETFKNEELQIPSIHNFYESLKHSKRLFHIDPLRKFKELSDKLKTDIDVIFTALFKAKDYSELRDSSNITRSSIVPCKDTLNAIFFTRINGSSENSFNRVLNSIYSEVWNKQNALKRVYLLSLVENTTPFQNIANSVRCNGIDYSLLWNQYMSHNSYRMRRIILVIDHGNSVEDKTLGLGKSFAKQMISALDQNDAFTVIGIASKWSSLIVTESCGNEHLPSILSASENNKELTYRFIDELESKSEITNHNVGMRIAIKMARLFYARDETVMLFFISRNIHFSMSEAMDIIALNDLSSPLVINTCVVSSDLNPDIREMSDFLNDFFMENGLKNQLISRGRLVLINDEYTAAMEVVRFYEMFNKKIDRSSIKVSLPTWDTKNRELILSFSVGYSIGNRYMVAGLDVSFTKFLRDIIYYSSYQKDMYTVLMDIKGNILVHPSVPLNKKIKFGHVWDYFDENHYRSILTNTEGTGSTLNNFEFSWKRIENFFVLLIFFEYREKSIMVQQKLNWLPTLSNNLFVKYLLDVTGDSCKYLGHIANFESSSLYLSESCFKYPNKNESTSSKLYPHDGFHEGIHDELTELVAITEMLKKKHLKSNSEYVIRRYAATKSGILQIFPGVAINFGYEPTKRPWFIRANELKGKIIATPPYLDAGGAGYIVTISYAISSIVLGIDVNYGFILKLILDKHPHCMDNITCFIVNDRGYLISYPDILRSLSNEDEPVEQLHLVHKESSVANDLLNHDELVRKLACSDYNTATVQRYYQLNTSYTNILSSSVPYISYSFGPINGTNLFFGIIKSTTSNTRTFCPCSVIDRICLNCNHMEKQECECPCECPIYRSSCSNYTSHDDYKICYPFLQNFSSDPNFNDNNDDIEQCPKIICNIKKTYSDCLGVIGCEWCQKDIYGFLLETPFCTTMYECFNGILGGHNPYKDGLIETNSIFSTTKNAGLLFGLIVIFVIAFISLLIWRNYNTPRSHRQRVYLSARQEEHLHMSDLNVNDDFLEQGNHSDKLLIDEKKVTPISPYCVASNYSRPTTAADSDHGYSTMTPHDESEHLSLAPVETDSLEDLASDRTTPPIKHKTLIPHKNCIIVPVTVHRQIDASS